MRGIPWYSKVEWMVVEVVFYHGHCLKFPAHGDILKDGLLVGLTAVISILYSNTPPSYLFLGCTTPSPLFGSAFFYFLYTKSARMFITVC